MRFVFLTVFVFFFVALPLYLLQTLVMPELASLQYTYQHVDEIAQQAAGQR